jgi:hypothetical protein
VACLMRHLMIVISSGLHISSKSSRVCFNSLSVVVSVAQW